MKVALLFLAKLIDVSFFPCKEKNLVSWYVNLVKDYFGLYIIKFWFNDAIKISIVVLLDGILW